MALWLHGTKIMLHNVDKILVSECALKDYRLGGQNMFNWSVLQITDIKCPPTLPMYFHKVDASTTLPSIPFFLSSTLKGNTTVV